MGHQVKRRRGYTRVSAKNQVTLPAESLRRAGLHAGDELAVTVDDQGRLILTAATDPFERLVGSAPGLSRDVGLQDLRDEWLR